MQKRLHTRFRDYCIGIRFLKQGFIISGMWILLDIRLPNYLIGIKAREYSGPSKYLQWTQKFADETGMRPVTCTFQEYVEGIWLPIPRKEKEAVIDPASFQKAYLLVKMILKMGSARSDNILYDPKTKKIYAIDNERFFRGDLRGEKNILDKFAKQKQLEIRSEVIENLLRVKPCQLEAIQKKYALKNSRLLQFWKEEPNSGYDWRDGVFSFLSDNESWIWDRIRENFARIQQATYSLLEDHESITLIELAEAIEKKKQESSCLIT